MRFHDAYESLLNSAMTLIKDIAKEFDVPFVALAQINLAQINRGVESQANKRPLMSDIKDGDNLAKKRHCDSFVGSTSVLRQQ